MDDWVQGRTFFSGKNQLPRQLYPERSNQNYIIEIYSSNDFDIIRL